MARRLDFASASLCPVILNEVKDRNRRFLRCAQNDNKGAEPRGTCHGDTCGGSFLFRQGRHSCLPSQAADRNVRATSF